jgi:hypothetical protein
MSTDRNDENDSTESHGGSGWLATIQQFDWLHVPGAARAVARLVAGTADVATTWLDIATAKGKQLAKAIRDETDARSTLFAATAKAAARQVSQRPELANRMLDRFIAEEIGKQENREEVAREAVRLLEENPPPTDTHGPSDDWLNIFSSFAETASSERMRQHWAQVLAGEIRKPGTFSLAALQIFAVMDPQLAACITRVRPWFIDNDFIPLFGLLNEGDNYTDFMSLSAVGVIILGSGKRLRRNDDGPPVLGPRALRFHRKALIVYLRPLQGLEMRSAVLTPAGREVLTIVEATDDTQMIIEIGKFFKAQGVEKVEMVDVIATPDGPKFENPVEI